MQHVQQLGEIEAQLARSSRRLGFTPALEKAFQHSYSAARTRLTQHFLLSYLLVNLFCLLCDRQAGPHALHLALLLRVVVFSPLVVGVWFALKRFPAQDIQGLAMLLPLLVDTALVTVLARESAAPFSDRYLLGAAVGILAQTLIVPIPLRYAACGLALSSALLAFLSMVPWPGHFHARGTPDLLFFTAATGLAFLHERYQRERSTRRDFLLSEANRLRMQQVLQTNAHLERLSSIDSLTGVFNRRYLDAALDRLWHVAQDHQRWIAVLMVDIDHFKQVNDLHGHQHGDDCLARVAQSMQASIRAGVDTVARYGGEEFIALLPDADLLVASQIAERVRSQVELLQLSAFAQHVVTVSIGAAVVQGHRNSLSLQDFITAADTALYEAKRSGRNRVVCRPTPTGSSDPTISPSEGAPLAAQLVS